MATQEMKLTGKNAQTLGALIAEVCVFAGTDKLRPILAAVKLDVDAGKLRMVATDSYALGTITTMIDAPDDLNAVIDTVGLAAIGKALTKVPAGVDVVFTFDADKLTVVAHDWTMTARIIDYGQYPQWESLVPTDNDNGDGEYPAISPMMLAKFAKVFMGRPKPTKKTNRNAQDKDYPYLKLEGHGARKVLVARASSEHGTFLGLVMPVRTW